MLGQLNMNGMDKVEVSIERIKTFEPTEGYYLAFSGGKDSIVVKYLCEQAGVKFDAHYNVTSVDPPELIYYMREYHKDVQFEFPRDRDGNRITMWNLIPKRLMPPTRLIRYCCAELKERGGEGRFVMSGVRWAESARRKNQRAGLEIDKGEKFRDKVDPDNPDNADWFETCITKRKHMLNPIIDWTDADVWEYIKINNIPYCKLYDEGYKRLGCIGCPMSSKQDEELERYPKYKQAYIKAFDRMIQARNEKEKDTEWKTGVEVMDWWISE